MYKHPIKIFIRFCWFLSFSLHINTYDAEYENIREVLFNNIHSRTSILRISYSSQVIETGAIVIFSYRSTYLRKLLISAKKNYLRRISTEVRRRESYF